MQDTTPEVRQLLAERYGALSPQERVRMCMEMFEFARLLVEASLPAGLDERTRRKLICERFYGRELAEHAFPELPK